VASTINAQRPVLGVFYALKFTKFQIDLMKLFRFDYIFKINASSNLLSPMFIGFYKS